MLKAGLLLIFLTMLLFTSIRGRNYEQVIGLDRNILRCPGATCAIGTCFAGSASFSGFTTQCGWELDGCPGIWANLVRSGDGQKIPLCKDQKTNCWKVWKIDSQSWECPHPVMNTCPVSQAGVSLVMKDNEYYCQDSFCPGLYSHWDEIYPCTKTDDEGCPGDGNWVKGFSGQYSCISPTCKFVKSGNGIYCPSDPRNCTVSYLTWQPYNPNIGWKCDYPVVEEKLSIVTILAVVVVLLIIAVIGLVLFMKKTQADKLNYQLSVPIHDESRTV